MKLFLFGKTENTFIRIIKNIFVYSFILSFVFTPLIVVFHPFKTLFSIFMAVSSLSFFVSLCILIIYGFIWFLTAVYKETKEERLSKKVKKHQELLSEKAENSTFLFKTEYSGYNDNANYQYWKLKEYFLTDEGEIIMKETSSQYDAHNIIRGWKSEIFQQITFEKFNDIINMYNVEEGKRYLGISETNYNSYIKKSNN